MPELYKISDVLVSIPVMDGLPQSFYEAMAAGCPIVCSNLSTYDGVVDHEITGLRVKTCDPTNISTAVLRILNNNILRNRLIINGHKILRVKGDIYREMSKMEYLYYKLLD